MKIFPAIDLINGKCVRLKQGDYKEVTVYNDDPISVGKAFMEAGASLIHVVDLDGAKEGKITNGETIKKMVDAGLAIEVGGGIRTKKDIETLLNMGVKRVILGSVAIKNPKLLASAIEEFGNEKIVLGVDAKNGKVAINGWLTNTPMSAIDLLLDYQEMGGKYVIYTDIAKDGMMQGPNLEEIKMMVSTKLKVVASGGVTRLEDLVKIKELKCYGAIVGKALYTKDIDLEEALAVIEC